MRGGVFVVQVCARHEAVDLQILYQFTHTNTHTRSDRSNALAEGTSSAFHAKSGVVRGKC